MLFETIPSLLRQPSRTLSLIVVMGFPGDSDGKESVCNVGDLNSIPGLEKSPGGRHDNPLQHLAWRIPMDRGACQAIVLRVGKTGT